MVCDRLVASDTLPAKTEMIREVLSNMYMHLIFNRDVRATLTPVLSGSCFSSILCSVQKKPKYGVFPISVFRKPSTVFV